MRRWNRSGRTRPLGMLNHCADAIVRHFTESVTFTSETKSPTRRRTHQRAQDAGEKPIVSTEITAKRLCDLRKYKQAMAKLKSHKHAMQMFRVSTVLFLKCKYEMG
uniref:Uncharacterized protein n=1 Tax=Knipowitschia caucasica TaxID=637954 RepID=A0AAV2KNM3_KNICA